MNFLFCLITQVINLRTIRPLDMDTVVRSVKKTHNLITVEGGWPQSSIGTEIITNTLESLYSGIGLGWVISLFLVKCTDSSGVSFLYNADVMTSALFGISKNWKLSFLWTAYIFAKYFKLRIPQCSISMFLACFYSKDCLHVAWCTNSNNSDYALMFEFKYSSKERRYPVST